MKISNEGKDSVVNQYSGIPADSAEKEMRNQRILMKII